MQSEFEVVSKPLKNHRYLVESKKPLVETEAYFAIEEPVPLEESPAELVFTEDDTPEKPKKKFEFFEEEKEGITEKLEEIINADGYYNEILPADSGEEIIQVKRKKAPPYIYLIAGLMFIAAIAMIAVNLGKLVG